MKLKSVKTKILIVPALFLFSLVILITVNWMIGKSISRHAIRAEISREITASMDRKLIAEGHYIHHALTFEGPYAPHVERDYIHQIEELNGAVSKRIDELNSIKNPADIAAAVYYLTVKLEEMERVFITVSDLLFRIKEEKRSLFVMHQDLNDYISAVVENLVGRETRLTLDERQQFQARKEFGDVLRDLPGVVATNTLNFFSFLLQSNEDAFKSADVRLSQKYDLILTKGDTLSAVTGNSNDRKHWESILSRLDDIKAHQDLVYQAWEDRSENITALETAEREVVLAAEEFHLVALNGLTNLLKIKYILNSTFLLFTGLGIILVSVIIARSIGHSLETLMKGTVAIADGDLEHRTGIESDDELGDLSKTLDMMARKLSISRKNLEHEIGQRKTIQEFLQASEAKYRNLFEHIQDSLIIADIETSKIEGVNQVALDTFGYTREEFLLMSVQDLGKGSERDRISRNMEMYRTEEITSNMIYSRTYVRKDGSSFPTEIAISRLTLGGRRKLIASIRDVSERRHLENQLQHSEKLESLGVLAGGIAHDFNNILMGVMGHAGMAHMKLSEDSPALDNISKIETAAQRLRDLTDQLLAYSGKGKLESTVFDIANIVEEMSGFIGAVIPKEINISYDLQDTLQLVNGDSGQIRQVIMNLITNAAEASVGRKGTVSVNTGVKSYTSEFLAGSAANPGIAAGQYVYVVVSDTGTGISDENLKKIFDPFFTTKDRGHGLGLAAVIGIIKAHEGALIVESMVGTGTTFTVLLPFVEDDTFTSSENLPLDRTSPSDWSILVVDDEEVVRDVAEAILTRGGMNVLTANNGLEAVDIFRESSAEFDLVLLDLSMPVMDGREAYLEIRDLNPDICVIFTSGYDITESMDDYSTAEFVSFIKKPYSPTDLLLKVHEIMSYKRDHST